MKITHDNNEFDGYDKDKINMLVECFDNLCDGEVAINALVAINVFLIKVYKKTQLNNTSIEEYSEKIKKLLIFVNRQFDDK